MLAVSQPAQISTERLKACSYDEHVRLYGRCAAPDAAVLPSAQMIAASRDPLHLGWTEGAGAVLLRVPIAATLHQATATSATDAKMDLHTTTDSAPGYPAITYLLFSGPLPLSQLRFVRDAYAP